MGWKWEFHGVEVAERRNLSAQGAAGFATFGGGFWGKNGLKSDQK